MTRQEFWTIRYNRALDLYDRQGFSAGVCASMAQKLADQITSGEALKNIPAWGNSDDDAPDQVR